MQKKRTRRKSDTAEKKGSNEITETGRKNELIGVGLITLGLVFLCGIAGFNVGFIGIYFAKFLQYFFGVGAIVPAVFFIYLGYHYIMNGCGLSFTKKSCGGALLFISLMAVYHHFAVPEGEEILPASLTAGGGLLGGAVLLVLRKLFGVTGGIVILGAGITGSVLLSTTWSLAKGILTTKEHAEKGAEVAAETAAVVYEKAKVVETKVQEKVVEQARQFSDNLSAMQENWKRQKEREKHFFDQANAGDYPMENVASKRVISEDEFSSSAGATGTIGFEPEDKKQVRKKSVATAGAGTVAGTMGFDAPVAESDGKIENIWGINSNPGERIAQIQQEIEAEEEAQSESYNKDEYDFEEAEESVESADVYDEEAGEREEVEENSSFFQLNIEEKEDEPLTDPYAEDGETDPYRMVFADESEEYVENNGAEDTEIEEYESYDDELDYSDEVIGEDGELDSEVEDNSADDTDPYDEEYEPFQSFGSSSKGRSWLDDITDSEDVDFEDLLTVGTIGAAAGTSAVAGAKAASAMSAVSAGTMAGSAVAKAGKMTIPAVSGTISANGEAVPYIPVEENEEEEIPEEEAEEIPYIMPKVEELLDLTEKADTKAIRQEIEAKAEMLSQTLKDFNVKASILSASRGPAVTQYEVKPAPGVKVNKITNLSDEIALNLAAPAVRIELIAGKAAIGIEVPNDIRDSVPLREVLEQKGFDEAKSKLTVGLGMDIGGKPVFADLAKMPHLLVAGATGSGKSVCINTLISSILFKAHPDEVKFILVDPKMVELSMYNDIPHLMVPVVTDAKKAASVLNWSVQEMERRYEQLKDAGVRNMDGYNKKFADEPKKQMCSIVIIIDELADLMMVAPHDVEDAICRIAQKARAAGIYLVLATQRPSVNVITGTIKANIPSRISFAVTSQIDSRTILDESGSEKLLGRGDMLFKPVGAMKPTRIQGAFISDDEVERLLDFIRGQGREIQVNQDIIDFTEKAAEAEADDDDRSSNTKSGGKKKRRNKSDELLGESMELFLSTGQASSSSLVRRFHLGYTTAQRIVDTLEEMGILGPATGNNKPREIIVSGDEAREILAQWEEDE